MALTCDWTQTVFGDRRAAFGLATMTGITSGAIQTPPSVILGGSVMAYSATSAVPNFNAQLNRASGGTATNGMLLIATCTAGDTFNVFVFGE